MKVDGVKASRWGLFCVSLCSFLVWEMENRESGGTFCVVEIEVILNDDG